jgi:hypothetical protein
MGNARFAGLVNSTLVPPAPATEPEPRPDLPAARTASPAMGNGHAGGENLPADGAQAFAAPRSGSVPKRPGGRKWGQHADLQLVRACRRRDVPLHEPSGLGKGLVPVASAALAVWPRG